MGKIRATRAAAKKAVKLTELKNSPKKGQKITELSQTTFDASKADRYLESDSWLAGAKNIRSLKSTPLKVYIFIYDRFLLENFI